MKIMKLFICVLTLFSYGILSKVYAQQVQELDVKLSGMRANPDANQKSDADKLQGLISDNKSSLYFQNGQLTQAGEQAPVRIITDVSSLGLLNQTNPLFSHVELICIKLENSADLNLILKISDPEAFKKLQYIYFLCAFEACPGDPAGSCLAERIPAMTTAFEIPAVKVLYKYSISQ